MAKFDFNAKEFERKAMQAAMDAVTKRLQGVRCPVHGMKATVKPKMSGSQMTWDIHGCCDELVAKAKAALK
jgi:hypothetical protein